MDRDYVCQICYRGFPTKVNAQVHIMGTHTEDEIVEELIEELI